MENLVAEAAEPWASSWSSLISPSFENSDRACASQMSYLHQHGTKFVRFIGVKFWKAMKFITDFPFTNLLGNCWVKYIFATFLQDGGCLDAYKYVGFDASMVKQLQCAFYKFCHCFRWVLISNERLLVCFCSLCLSLSHHTHSDSYIQTHIWRLCVCVHLF